MVAIMVASGMLLQPSHKQLKALTNKIDKMHIPTQKSYHTNNYNKSCGHNKAHNHNRQHHSRYQHKQHNKLKQQTQIAEVEVCDHEKCNHSPDYCTDCDSNPLLYNAILV